MVIHIRKLSFLASLAFFVWPKSVLCFLDECRNTNNTSDFHYRYESFNHGIVCEAAQKPVEPETLTEIQEVVHSALRNGYTVKPLGNRHSATDIICTKGISLRLSKVNHFSYDHSTNLVTVGAGATIGFLLEKLHTFGRTIYGIPTYYDITIGGTIGTGAHGTSFRSSATLSDNIISLVIVDGLGNVQNISDPKTLRAFRAHLGLLGVVYEVTLLTIPQHKLHIKNFLQPDNLLWNSNEILQLAKSTDRFQFFWFPTSKQVVISVGHRVPLSTDGTCQTNFISEVPRAFNERLFDVLEKMQEDANHLGFFVAQQLVALSFNQKVHFRSPLFSNENSNEFCNPAIGYSHRMSANRCKECSWSNLPNRSVLPYEMAVVIPLTDFQGAINTMKNILDEFPAEFPVSGIYFRFLPASDGLLTLNSGRASVAIEWVTVPRMDKFDKPSLGLPVYQALLQALIHEHQGRPHWAKNGLLYIPQKLLFKLYPKLNLFINQMEKFDPKGVFLNEFGRRLRFGYAKTSMDSSFKHCALVDRCICRKDGDCGDGSSDSHFCGTIKGYRVCRERTETYRQHRGRFLRYIVRSFVTIKRFIDSSNSFFYNFIYLCAYWFLIVVIALLLFPYVIYVI